MFESFFSTSFSVFSILYLTFASTVGYDSLCREIILSGLAEPEICFLRPTVRVDSYGGDEILCVSSTLVGVFSLTCTFVNAVDLSLDAYTAFRVY